MLIFDSLFYFRAGYVMNFSKLGLAVIETEAQAIMNLSNRIDETFDHACQLLLKCEGRIVVIGMGKSGHIGGKIAATLASTGSPAFFVHPGEASHGDMGMITAKDVVIAISNSGNTQEIITLLPLLKRLDIPMISITGNPQSILSEHADVNLDVSVEHEACPLGLAPTTSTTASLVMGDALAIALLEARGFSVEDFALSHPGGNLGKKLLLKVNQLAHYGDHMPIVDENATISEALIEVTAKKLGFTAICDKQGKLSGIFTDGDIRRALNQNIDLHTTSISQIMTKNCQTVGPELLAVEALQIMEQHKITALIIVDEKQHAIAALHLHDLLRSGVC
jgi:arabinose-5-phosphate isomerase